MTICLFGTYKPDYARAWVLRTGFERLGHTVIECRSSKRSGRFLYLNIYLELYREYKKIRHRDIDLVIVCFPGPRLVWLARLLFGHRVVFDAFLSVYDTNVGDRKFYSVRNIRAWRDWVLDWFSVACAPVVLLECNAYIDYFARTFKVPRRKFIRVWVSANDDLFRPLPIREPEIFTVQFHGNFIPLQGVRYILEAAKILRNELIDFRIIGDGQEYELASALVREHKLTRVQLLGHVPNAEIPELLASAHISLGIFGDTEKTQHVIANKVYEAIATGRPVITADTPAMRELMPAAKEACLVPAADSRALAKEILHLKYNPDERIRFGEEGRRLFVDELLPEMVVSELIGALKSCGVI
jgi:glycosyltransferase involved in cell wall biosynthesis